MVRFDEGRLCECFRDKVGIEYHRGLKTKMETKESIVAFFTNEGISDIRDLMAHIQVFIDSPELIFELPVIEREKLEARMDEALSAL
jgi:hypothetical protein